MKTIKEKHSLELQIEESLFNAVSGSSDIVLLEIDTSAALDWKWIVPYLNLYSSNLPKDKNFDESFKKSIENEDMSYLYDIIDGYEDQFNINISNLYPKWPNEIENWDKKLVEIINTIISKYPDKFAHLQIMYLTHIESFEFKKLINKKF